MYCIMNMKNKNNMKNTKYILLTIVAVGFFVSLNYQSTVSALGTFQTWQGGTGTTTPSGILYGDNGSSIHLNTVTIGSNLTFSAGTLSATGGGSTVVTTTEIWVDSNRVDAYTPDGSISKPYKTIGTAIQTVPAIYHLATGSYIEDALTFTATSTIEGNQSAIFSYSGTPFASPVANITFRTGAIIDNTNILAGNVYMTDPAVSDPGTFQNSLINGNLYMYGLAIFQGGQLQGGTVYTGTGSLTNFLGVNILDQIFVDGTINLNDVNVQPPNLTGKYAIIATTTGSIIDINGLSLENTASGGGGILCTNGATTIPNNITNIGLTLGTTTDIGSINCGSAASSIGSYAASNLSGGKLYAVATNLVPYSFAGLSVEGNTILATRSGRLGVGTTTPTYPIDIASSTAPQIAFGAGQGVNQWTFRAETDGSFEISTTTVAGDATTTDPVIAYTKTGFLRLINSYAFLSLSYDWGANGTDGQITPGQTFTRFSFATASTTKVDKGSNWSTANNWYTVPISGYYQVAWGVRLVDNSTNGTGWEASGSVNADDDEPTGQWCQSFTEAYTRSQCNGLRVSHFNKGDTVRLVTYWTAATSVKMQRASMSIVLISAD